MASVEEAVKLKFGSFTCAPFAMLASVMTGVVGAMVSTIQERETGALSFPAPSIATTDMVFVAFSTTEASAWVSAPPLTPATTVPFKVQR